MTLAFNEDRVVQREVERIVRRLGIRYAIETGAGGGATTEYLATLVPQVVGIEYDHNHYVQYLGRLNNVPGIVIVEGDSAQELRRIIDMIPRDQRVLFYLDAHTPTSSPLPTELEIIGEKCFDRAVVIIDDFCVPNRSLGFDVFGGTPNDLDFIGDRLRGLATRVFYYFSDAADVTNPVRNTAGKIYVFPLAIAPREFTVQEGEYFYSDLR